MIRVAAFIIAAISASAKSHPKKSDFVVLFDLGVLRGCRAMHLGDAWIVRLSIGIASNRGFDLDVMTQFVAKVKDIEELLTRLQVQGKDRHCGGSATAKRLT